MSLLLKNQPDQLKADTLLAINIAEPEQLFTTPNAAQIKKEFHALAKIWHSDVNKDPHATTIMQHLKTLYDKANEKIEKGNWEIPNVFMFTTREDKKYKISYKKKTAFELGTMYIADTSVTFALDKKDRDLFDNAKDIIGGLTYANDKMREQFTPIMPQIKATFETADKLIMVMRKDPSDILLADVIAYEKGKIDPKHAAWMMSRLHNITCYLNFAGIAHNAISPETCFVSPEHHGMCLLGGWWYAAKVGTKLKALPPKTVALAPPQLLTNPIATPRFDLNLIRATGREILGDATGGKLIANKDIPEPMVSWVTGATTGDAVKDYKIWSEQILTKSFGARRFVEMKLSPNDIYTQ